MRDWSSIMGRRSDESLQEIIDNSQDWPADEVQAAIEELERRHGKFETSVKHRIQSDQAFEKSIVGKSSFPPFAMARIPLDDLSAPQFLTLALAAFQKLEWEVEQVSPNGMKVRVKDTWGARTSEEVTIKIQEEEATIQSKSLEGVPFDGGRNRKSLQSFYSTFDGLKIQIDKEKLDQQYGELQSGFSGEAIEDLQTEPGSSNKIKDFFLLLTPSPGYTVTPIVMILNVLIYVIMVIAGVHFFMPNTTDMIEWGANFKPLTLDGDWWRVITCNFLHFGVWHLAINMYALLYVGGQLEPMIGKSRFVAAYLLTGIVSSIASLWWNDFVVSAGASGAVFGMYGLFLALVTTDLIENEIRNSLLKSLGIFVVLNLVIGSQDGIDNAAHIGGLLSGIAIGYVFYLSISKPQNQALKGITIAGVAVLTLVGSAFAFTNLSGGDISKLEEYMEEFSVNETRALNVYQVIENNPSQEVVLQHLKDSGIYSWERNLTLLKEIEEMDGLPKALATQNKSLIKYCKLRKETYEYLYKAIELDDEDAYRNEIDSLNEEVNNLLEALNSQ